MSGTSTSQHSLWNLEKNGDKVHIDKLSEKLGCEVVEISALKGIGIQKAAQAAVAAAHKEAAAPVHVFHETAERAIMRVEEQLGQEIPYGQKRFFAIKLLEKDEKIASLMDSAPDAEFRRWKRRLMTIQKVSSQMSGICIFPQLSVRASQKGIKTS